MTARSAPPQWVRLTNLLCRACGVTCTLKRWPKPSRPFATRISDQQRTGGAKALAEPTQLTLPKFKPLPVDRQFHRPSHVDEVSPNSRVISLRAQALLELDEAFPIASSSPPRQRHALRPSRSPRCPTREAVFTDACATSRPICAA